MIRLWRILCQHYFGCAYVEVTYPFGGPKIFRVHRDAVTPYIVCYGKRSSLRDGGRVEGASYLTSWAPYDPRVPAELPQFIEPSGRPKQRATEPQ